MTEPKLKTLTQQFLNDVNLSELNSLRKKENVFSILKLHNAEIRHSNFLAWLLNPNESHQLGDYFLKLFLLNLLNKEIQVTDSFELELTKSLTGIRVFREYNNIDLVIEAGSWVAIIENKNRSGEGNGQLQAYYNFAENVFAFKERYYIYLTLWGTKPSHSEFCSYSYSEIAKILNDILSSDKFQLSQRNRIYIEDYLQTLTDIGMTNNELKKLSQLTYFHNKELFDFIISNKGDSVSSFAAKFSGFLSEKKNLIIGSSQPNFVRFYPESLSSFIPKGKGLHWEFGEAFLFEFFLHKDVQIELRATINLSDAESAALYQQIFKDKKGFRNQVIYANWMWCFEIIQTYNRDIVFAHNEQKETAHFESLFLLFEQFIKEVSALILNDESGAKEKLKILTEQGRLANQTPKK